MIRPIWLADVAQGLPRAWTSSVVASFGDARLKLLRMDESAYPEECHDYPEGLLVLDGTMMLQLAEDIIQVRAGELCVVPAGVPHSVAAGSQGSLLIIDA